MGKGKKNIRFRAMLGLSLMKIMFLVLEVKMIFKKIIIMIC